MEGSEDVPVHRGSFVFTIKNGVIDSFILKPEKFGLYADEAKLNKPLSAEEQAEKKRPFSPEMNRPIPNTKENKSS